MATIVCRGLQSCHESQVFEPRATIRLKLSCSVVDDGKKRSHCENNLAVVDDGEKKLSSSSSSFSSPSRCWSFLQAASKLEARSSYKEAAAAATTTYVLSVKSLELCTENLGSETGTDDIMQDDISIGISSSRLGNGGNVVSPRREQQAMKCCGVKKAISRDYPPPLTTIRGAHVRRLRPRRENGRLIIEATEAPPPRCPLFHAERSNGRLRLSLFKDYSVSEEGDIGNDAGMSCRDEEEKENDKEEGEEEEEEEGNVKVHHHEVDFDAQNEDEGVNGDNRELEGEMGIKTFQRPGRCKGGETDEKKRLLNWEALCAATS